METIGFNCKDRIWPCGRVEGNRERRTYEMHKYLGSQVCVVSFVRAKARIQQNPLKYKDFRWNMLVPWQASKNTRLGLFLTDLKPVATTLMHGCKMSEHYNATHPAPSSSLTCALCREKKQNIDIKMQILCPFFWLETLIKIIVEKSKPPEKNSHRRIGKQINSYFPCNKTDEKNKLWLRLHIIIRPVPNAQINAFLHRRKH